MIKYKKREQQIKNDPVAIANVMYGETYNAKAISNIIEKEVGIPAIRTMSVLAALSEVVAKTVTDGGIVSLDGIGNLKPYVTFSGGHPVISRIAFTPSLELKAQMKTASFEEVEE